MHIGSKLERNGPDQAQSRELGLAGSNTLRDRLERELLEIRAAKLQQAAEQLLAQVGAAPNLERSEGAIGHCRRQQRGEGAVGRGRLVERDGSQVLARVSHV